MAELRSVLLVDFDSLHRSLTAGGGEAAARFSLKVPGWLGGMETGRLLGPDTRAFAVKRCYADPKAIGDSRANFTNAGFEVIDCPAGASPRGVDMLIAMDAVEQLADEGVDEFILMSAEPTLSPLLTRLKAAERRTVVYSDSHTAQAYRPHADTVLDVAAFAEFLLIHDAPDSSSALVVERSEIEAFARRIHAATNIPLFSPRTFAELFRLLTEEIVANGYHFQTTAKNVADKLSESGRSVTRRQVVFIVKGLALKGHVFSTTDTPRRLAEVFREQARYLIDNAGVTLDEGQERILSAWLVDRAPASLARPAPSPAPAPVPAPPPAAARPTAMPAPAMRSVAETPAPPMLAAAQPAKPSASPPAAKAEAPRPPAAPKAAEKPIPAAVAAMDRSQSAPVDLDFDIDEPKASPPAVQRSEPRPSPPMISPDDARAAIAAKIAQSVRPKPGARPSAKAALVPPPPPPTADEADDERPLNEPQSIENSILAAIAEAVDVLVEDGEPTTAKPKKAAVALPPPPPSTVPATRKRTSVPATAGARPQPESRPAAERAPEPATARQRAEPRRQEGEDIGDEIQRIIATYNRNRKDETPGQG